MFLSFFNLLEASEIVTYINNNYLCAANDFFAAVAMRP